MTQKYLCGIFERFSKKAERVINPLPDFPESDLANEPECKVRHELRARPNHDRV